MEDKFMEGIIMRPFKIALLIMTSLILFLPSFVHAGEELYDKPGFDPTRDPFSLADIEPVDPFT